MPNVSRKNPIYQQLKMLHPDGTLMCRVSKKRALWFINKNLATWTKKDEEFQLNFEPAGYGKFNLPFYTQVRNNCCVVCGSTHELNVHHVFPRVFRKNMPILYKSSNSHDVLAVCADCHEEYEEKANDLKKRLGEQYLGLSDLTKMSVVELATLKIKRARKFINSLNKNGEFLKNGRLNKPPQSVIEMYQLEANKDISDLDNSHWGKKIMDIVLQQGGEQEFVNLWRKHFVDEMTPQYLPEHWDIYMPLEKTKKIRDDVNINKYDLIFFDQYELN